MAPSEGKQPVIYVDGKPVGVLRSFSVGYDHPDEDGDEQLYADHPYVRGTHGAERKIRIRTLKRLVAQDQDK